MIKLDIQQSISSSTSKGALTPEKVGGGKDEGNAVAHSYGRLIREVYKTIVHCFVQFEPKLSTEINL